MRDHPTIARGRPEWDVGTSPAHDFPLGGSDPKIAHRQNNARGPVDRWDQQTNRQRQEMHPHLVHPVLVAEAGWRRSPAHGHVGSGRQTRWSPRLLMNASTGTTRRKLPTAVTSDMKTADGFCACGSCTAVKRNPPNHTLLRSAIAPTSRWAPSTSVSRRMARPATTSPPAPVTISSSLRNVPPGVTA